MGLLLIIALVAVIVVFALKSSRSSKVNAAEQLADEQAEARRWVERLGGQVMNLTGTNDASKQAIADASERYTAAGSQVDLAKTVNQYRMATETAYEGLHYIRAARTAMGIDPGPELPPLPGQQKAGQLTEARQVQVDGNEYYASPNSGPNTNYYYPGGMVNGRPVPQGWYSTPWWKTALTGAAAGIGGFLIADALFSGLGGLAYNDSFAGGMGDFGGGFDGGGMFDGGDFGGGDFGGFDDF
jgi:hypothetical protein